MKKIYNILIILMVFSACTDERDLSFIDVIEVPTNVAAAYNITQDNTGLVTISPTAEGASKFFVYFGDDTTDAAELNAGESINHIYEEGMYNVVVQAFNLKGDEAEITQELQVSFKAPENLVTTLVNSESVSKQVEITATAEYATMYEFYSGEVGVDQPVATGNIGETITYQYADAGTYAIEIIAKGAAIETTNYTATFEVTAIEQPITSAPTPPNRADSDVISIYSSAYSNVAGTDTFPDWGQAGQGSGWTEFDLDGDVMLQYINLSYQGIQFGASQDVSGMEFLHLDVWTTGVTQIETSLINIPASGSGTTEAPVTNDLTANGWTSINIPISDYTDQGLTVNEILQLKFVGTPWAAGTVFIDNIYFYKESTVASNGITPLDFETAYSLSSFDGGDISVVANPDTNGNTSSMVAQMIKGSGQPWAGSKITVPAPFNFSSNAVITAKVWSPRAGLNLLLKFEDDVPWPDVSATAEITATTTVANQWETVTFDFTGLDTSIDWYNLVLIMDNGTVGDGSSNYTIYIDDISSNPLLDFEPEFTLSSFDGGDISIIANPDTNGNTSSMVGQMIKGSGQPWAGSKITFPTPFDFSSGTTITVKVWSPRAGLNLLLKFEDDVPWPDVSATAEITATTTVANQWETLTFDFAGVDTSIDWYNLVLIMDNGTAGDGSSNYTIYIDDIDQN